jgi:uncharacterized protein YllA (UPF0747 family)
MSNILEERIDKIINAKIEDFADAFTHGLTENKQLYQLTEDVAVKFMEWVDKLDKFMGMNNKQLFQYFINNIYKP